MNDTETRNDKNGSKIKKKFQLFFWSIAGIIFFILLWEIISKSYASNILFPGPFLTLERFFNLLLSQRFYSSLWGSFLRVIAGILTAVPLGIIFGIACGMNKKASAFFRPLFSVIAATPVISVILIIFIVMGSSRTPSFTAFLMIFPIVSSNVIEGIKSMDPCLTELFISFRMNKRETIKYLYMPFLSPFILGALKSSLSLCWKVVVAAEVIVQPLFSLGLSMQNARIMLDTPELFALTLATIIAAGLSQLALSLAVRFINPVYGKISHDSVKDSII